MKQLARVYQHFIREGLEQGIIGECGKGFVRFDMPAMRGFLEERLGE